MDRAIGAVAGAQDGVPLYVQVLTDLTERIRRGEFEAGQALPTEESLCREYDVSRITIRRAVEQLVSTLLLERRRGVGTFVRPATSNAKMLRLFGHLQDVLTFDQRLHYDVLRRGAVLPPKPIATAFAVKAGVRLYSIETVNRVGGEAYAVSRFYFAPEFTEFADGIALEDDRPPLRYLEQAAGVRVESGQQTIEPATIRGRHAKCLDLPAGTPVLSTLRRYFAVGHKLVEAVHVLYHPDRYHFDIHLLTPGARLRTDARALKG